MTAVAVVGVGMTALFIKGPPPAPPRPKPAPPPESVMNGELRFSPVIYRGQVEQDARSFGVPTPSEELFKKPFLYMEEVKKRLTLVEKRPVETPHLKLSLVVEKQRATTAGGQGFRSEHLVLQIENLSDKYLAYRIVTEVPNKRKCIQKGDIPHNAMVIEPRQTLRRTECLFQKKRSLDIKRAEVIELPELAAVYVSRLPIPAVLYDPRTAAGHVPLKGSLCPQTFSWREIRDGLDRKHIDWRDVIDYYARHSCSEYSFFKSYRYRSNADEPLPARPME